MKIYQAELTVKIRMPIWVDDEQGQTESDIPSIAAEEIVYGEANIEIVGKPVLDRESLVLTREVPNDELLDF